MVKLLFIIPLLMCVIWYLYLQQNNWTLAQGKKGFLYIISFNLVIALVLTLLVFATRP
ncbi:MAG: hypothetical protein R3187_03315 [Arsukibacterium sp.]|nr:hypothetical protein [Arsukibacterium sp.]